MFNHESYPLLTEDVNVSLLGVYGITKREGKEFITQSNIYGIIINTPWLYFSFGNNFVKIMLHLGIAREELNVIFDQI